MTRGEKLQTERFVFWYRNPPEGLRYIRATFAKPNTRPGPLVLANRTVFGWTLDQFGDCVRLFYAILEPGPDGLPDGTGDYHIDVSFKDSEAGTWAGLKKPLGPMPPENSSPALIAEERMARRAHAEHWVLHFEKQAARERELRAAAKVEPPPVIVVARPKPKTWLQSLLGR